MLQNPVLASEPSSVNNASCFRLFHSTCKKARILYIFVQRLTKETQFPEQAILHIQIKMPGIEISEVQLSVPGVRNPKKSLFEPFCRSKHPRLMQHKFGRVQIRIQHVEQSRCNVRRFREEYRDRFLDIHQRGIMN